MYKYEYAIILCGGYADGSIAIRANYESEAYEKMMEIVGDKLYEAFPELDIEYAIELIDTDEPEDY